MPASEPLAPIEETILSYLRAQLPVPAFAAVPEKPPPAFLVLQKTGGGRKDLICTGLFTLQSYAGSLLEAARLNKRARAAMDGLCALDEISGVHLETDYPFNDPVFKQYRYQAVYHIAYYE